MIPNHVLSAARVCIAFMVLANLSGNVLIADDYFLTIGGGYNPSGNQASLEANVLFFQQLLEERHRGTRRHDVYFADGSDAGADLQILAPKPATQNLPASDLLASLHRRRGQQHVTYRNHRVPQIAGPLEPNLVKTNLDAFAKNSRGGRLIIYVTAHGSNGPKDDPYNTTIDCWNEKKITAREFTGWLAKLPAEMPVVMVMAQCYCGGFAHTIFEDLDPAKGLAKQIRAGFFAQQYNLPAAGCRPDIEHDEEFSSYFWGAIAGRSRNGAPISDCDIDGNGRTSFAEAYAYAVISGETIDIPLRTSDVFLRTFSRLSLDKPADAAPATAPSAESDSDADAPATASGSGTSTDPLKISGTLQSFVDRGSPVNGRIVAKLTQGLGFSNDDDVEKVVKAYEELRRGGRFGGRGGRRRGGSGRRDLLKEIGDKWPELADERHWEQSALLKPENQELLFAELKELPSWKAFEERRQQMATSGDQNERNELRTVKFRRLINTLEVIVLDKNLPQIATVEIMERFRQLTALEQSELSPPTQPVR